MPAAALKAPPRGRLFQEDLSRPRDRFWMLVACVLVNRCTWEAAEPVHRELRRRYSIRALALLRNDRGLVVILRPLGFQNQRARKLRHMALAWLSRRPVTAADVERLPGCGRYAADSWAIFVDARTDVQPTDGKLLWHVMGRPL